MKQQIRVFTKFSKLILDETNNLRFCPSKYITKLKHFLSSNECNKEFKISSGEQEVVISEGKEAIEEAIEFLDQQNPLESFNNVSGLTECADELLNYLIITQSYLHENEVLPLQ